MVPFSDELNGNNNKASISNCHSEPLHTDMEEKLKVWIVCFHQKVAIH